MSHKYLWLLLVCCTAFLPLASDAGHAPNQESSEMSDIDKQIKECKDKIASAKMQAYIAGSDADQYLGEDWEDYQRAIARQEMYQAQVKELEVKLAHLQKQKAAGG